MSVDRNVFRSAVGRYPTGVVVITCIVDGVDHAMTANSFTSVSLDPPLVMFGCEIDSRFHEAIVQTDRWGVSVLTSAADSVATWFAKSGRPLADQFAKVPHTRAESGVLFVNEAGAWMDCKTVSCVTAGDHDVIIGQVENIPLVNQDAHPLVYFDKKFIDLRLGDTPMGHA